MGWYNITLLINNTVHHTVYLLFTRNLFDIIIRRILHIITCTYHSPNCCVYDISIIDVMSNKSDKKTLYTSVSEFQTHHQLVLRLPDSLADGVRGEMALDGDMEAIEVKPQGK